MMVVGVAAAATDDATPGNISMKLELSAHMISGAQSLASFVYLRPRELRQLRCELGVLGNADGSAMFEMGNSKVVAGVFGPREGWSRGASEAATIRCEYNIAAFATGERRKRQKTDWRSMEEAAAIRAVLEQTVMVHLMPISQILVAVHVIQADGGARSAAINAAFMAAADAGIPMKETVAACAAGWLSRTAVLDLNYVEEAAGTAAITVALHPGSQQVVSAHMEGSWAAVSEAQELMDLAAQGCMAVVAFMRTTLLTRSSRLAAAQNLDSAL